jgi:hypothetical protein
VGPSSSERSFNWREKSGWPSQNSREAEASPASATSGLFAERVRATISPHCSEECREEARRWREGKARHHYRQCEGGKSKRRAQSRRYRLRSKRARAAKQGPRRTRGSSQEKYFAAPAIGLAAMRNSNGVDLLPCSDFVRTAVGAPPTPPPTPECRPPSAISSINLGNSAVFRSGLVGCTSFFKRM